MKRVLVTFVLALTAATLAAQQPTASASAQGTAAQGPEQNTPTSQKVIKDPAEYNAYITALNTTDPAAKGAAMEAFVAQYPNSIVKVDALEQAMGAYQQAASQPGPNQAAQQQKVEGLARQILQIEPNNVRALAIVVFLERGQVKDAASGAKARGDAEHCLQELPNWKQPEGVTPADYQKMRAQMENICAGTAAFGALQQQDNANAKKYYEQALKVDPSDLANNYQMAIALLQSNPMDPVGFWYGAKALSLAQAGNPQAFQAWSPYFQSKYKKYHGNTDDWAQRITAAGSQTAPPPDFVASIPLAPTTCDLAAQAVQQNGADNLSFSDWEMVLGCRDKKPENKAAADQVWQAIQTKQKNGEAKLKIPVKVVSATADSIDAAITDENQAANKPDLHIVMEKPMTKPPAANSTTDIIGVLTNYTPDPFMFTMEKGELPVAAKKPPVHHAPVKKKKKAA